MPQTSKIRDILRERALRPNKALGQNFLICPKVVDKIIEAVDPGPADHILEIGPGLGSLTVPLAHRAGRMMCVELDDNMADALAHILRDEGLENADIIRGDFLDISACAGQKVVGALPYYITTPAIRKIFDLRPRRVVLLLQKEAAARLTAAPGDKDYGILALETAYHAKVTVIADAPPACFYPAPQVHSRAVRLDMFDAPPVRSDKGALFRVITAAFAMRRKTLQNCLVAGLNITRGAAVAAICACGLPEDVRGERLGLMDFDALTLALSDLECCHE